MKLWRIYASVLAGLIVFLVLQGVVSNVLAIESFGAAFPDIYMYSNLKVSWIEKYTSIVYRLIPVFKGWFVSTLLLSASLSGVCGYCSANEISCSCLVRVACQWPRL